MSAAANADKSDAKIPNWAPGAYVLANFAQGVHDLKAYANDLSELKVEKVKDNDWRIDTQKGKPFKVVYFVNVPAANEIIHFSGPSTYLYIEGRKNEKCSVTMTLPDGWKLATGLDPSGRGPMEFSAPNYDVLIDNPVTAGKFESDTYVVEGKTHTLAYRGAAVAKLDRAKVTAVCKQITEICSKFFGGLPYKRYVWHFNVFDAPDGGGGLEHLCSTQISLSSGFGPGAQHVCAHEFFHLWNVKRIRSSVLGPFEYDFLPKTGALWWLEGVTDYYSALLLYRCGHFDEKWFWEEAMRNINAFRSNAERFNVSIYDASFRVGEANDGRGNSSGYKQNYYNAGWVAGLCLDLEIRAQSANRNSLDSIELALWNMCRDGKPGFSEMEIRRLCKLYGGEVVQRLYDQWIALPGDIQIEDALAKAGYQIVSRKEDYAGLGIEYRPDPDRKGVRVIRASGPSEGKLMPNDLIVSIGNQQLAGLTPRGISAVFDSVSANKPVHVVAVRKDGQQVSVDLVPALYTRDVKLVTDLPRISDEQKAVRTDWQRGGVGFNR